MSEPPDPALQLDRPRPPRRLMDLPHELIVKVITEVILEDRATGRDQVRANSGTYALSRTNAYWQAEVEGLYRKLYVETSLFPGFAIWSLQSDWLFRRDAFSPNNNVSPPGASASEVDGVTTPRPRTQASSVSPKPSRSTAALSCSRIPDYQAAEGVYGNYPQYSDTDSEPWPGLSDAESDISITYAPRPPRTPAMDLTQSQVSDACKVTGDATADVPCQEVPATATAAGEKASK